jgi:hypothetical protein
MESAVLAHSLRPELQSNNHVIWIITYFLPVLSVRSACPKVVSSQEIQLPQGVLPPGQLTNVQLKLTKSLTTSSVLGFMINVVVPPAAVSS